MNKEYLQNRINYTENTLKRLPDMNLGQLLYHNYCSEAVGCSKDYLTTIEMFKFRVNNHDTGISINCWIVNNDEELEIINKTYWKTCGYSSSGDFLLKGAWDKKLKEVIEHIRSENIKLCQKSVDNLKKELDTLIQEENSTKSRFEEMFK